MSETTTASPYIVLRTAYLEGREAYREGQTFAENPYSDERAAHWLDGWTDEQEGIEAP